MDEADLISEQRLIEKYLQQFSLEDCLDEILNQVVSDRPSNPYLAIAKAFEKKTVAEILDVRLSSILVGGHFAVKASVLTNIGTYEAICSYPIDEHHELLDPKDYTVLDGKLREVLIPLDPKNLKLIDDAITNIADIHHAESLAVSKACCRAAAQLSGLKVHEYLAEFSGNKVDNMTIPIPVITLALNPITSSKAIQKIQIFPVKSSSLDSAIHKINTLVHKFMTHERISKPQKFSHLGTPIIDIIATEDIVKAVNGIIAELELQTSLKVGLGLQGEDLGRPMETDPSNYSYLSALGMMKQGPEYIEQLLTFWQEVEFISLDNFISFKDTNMASYFNKRVQETVYDAKNAGDKLKYCVKGIGGESSCSLQITLDSIHLLSKGDEFEKQLKELPYNTVKFTLNSFPSVTKAIDIWKKAKKYHLGILLDTSYLSTPDDFESDFAVGLGIKEILGNGFFEREFNFKLNRLQDIIRDNLKIVYAGEKFRESN